jgi:hypothetical protein
MAILDFFDTIKVNFLAGSTGVRLYPNAYVW